MAKKIDFEEEYENAIRFLDGRDPMQVPVGEIHDFCEPWNSPNPNCDYTYKKMVRLIVYAEYRRCKNDSSYRKRREDNKRDERGFWYQKVKPFLSRVEPDAEVKKDGWGNLRSDKLSKVLSEMALDRFLKYEDVCIWDSSRTHERPQPWEKYSVGRFDEVIIFIEKDSSYDSVVNLAKLLGFTVESGSGQQSTASIEGLINHLSQDKEYLIFCLSDYDKSGDEIVKSLEKRLLALGLDCDVHQLGVNPDDIPKEELEVNKYLLRQKNKKEKKWAEKHGIDRKYGLEIEAVPPERLRELIAEATYEFCDVEDLYGHLLEEDRSDTPSELSRELWKDHGGVKRAEKEVGEKKVKAREETKEIKDKIKRLREEIKRIEEKYGVGEAKKKRRRKVEEVKGKIKERAEDRIDDADDRNIPDEWLKEKIVEGGTNLRLGPEIRDKSGLKEDLKRTIVRDMEKLSVKEAS